MAGPHIGAGAQIGVNVTILPFVRIGAGAMIGSGSVVTRDIEPGMVAYGNPALPRRRVADLPQIGNRVAAMATASGLRRRPGRISRWRASGTAIKRLFDVVLASLGLNRAVTGAGRLGCGPDSLARSGGVLPGAARP